MKPITQQVDEFIEGVFSGSITHLLQKSSEDRKIPNSMYSTPEMSKIVGDTNSNLFNTLIPQYMTSEEPDKEQLAKTIHKTVIQLGVLGIIDNSPINLDELNFLRTENSSLKAENAQLKEQVKDLATKLLALSPPEDKKVGIT
jgi:hypothetical protein